MPLIVCVGLAAAFGSLAFAQASSVDLGAWGGDHIALDVHEAGAMVEFDCAHGALDQPLTLDRNGRFDVTGSFTTEGPGPTRRNPSGRTRAARYSGRLSGSTLTLTVILADTNETLGAFTLTRDKPRITKCR